jgi:di/tricarboxylate transporter
MQRPLACVLGLLLIFFAFSLHLNVGAMFTHFSWSGNAIEISREYQYMRAWIDVFNIAMLAGLALALIGWVVPSRPAKSDK